MLASFSYKSTCVVKDITGDTYTLKIKAARAWVLGAHHAYDSCVCADILTCGGLVDLCKGWRY